MTPRQFLTRVAFKSKMATLCDYQYVQSHDDDEKIEFDKLDGGDGGQLDGEEANPASAPTPTQNLCRICLENQCSVLFMLCRHLQVCTPCYTTLYAKEKAEYAAEMVHWYEDNDLLDAIDIPVLIIKCPICREKHEKKDIMIDIYL